jgi:UPF0755 protein
VNQSADTGAFAVIEPEDRPGRGRRRGRDPEPPPVEEERRGRFGRRKRSRRAEEPAADTGEFLSDAPEEPGSYGAYGSGALEQVEQDEEPAGRRGGRRRARGRGRAAEAPDEGYATGEMSVEEFRDEEPTGRSGRAGRRKRSRRAEEPAADTGAFLSDAPEEPGSYGTGAFEQAEEPGPWSGSFEQVDEPVGRRGRAAEAPDEGFATGEMSVGAPDVPEAPEAPEEEEPAPRRSRRRRAGSGDEPAGRRSRRRRGRGRRASDGFDVEDPREPLPPEPEPEAEADEDDDYEYEEPALDDIAAAYGNSRRQREMKRRAKQARQRKGGSGRGRRKGQRKTLMIILVVILVLVVVGGGYGIVRTYVFPADYSGEGSGEVVFVIESGASGTAVGENLVDAGVVASTRAFTNALDAVPPDELGDGLVPGTYSLAEEMSGESAVAALLDQDNRLGGRVGIPEGLRAEDIFERIAESTTLSQEELAEAYAQTDELGLPEYATAGPEGYLFPATYRFEPDADAMSVLRTMVTQYRQVAEEIDLEARAEAEGYDANEVMAMAAIIQAESGSEEDMPMVSRVIHNRLDIGMNLGMDSTCFYAIGEYGIALNNDQLAACESDTSGYDTYHKSGLPPGPIVAPGEAAIEAALEPADGDWLYFVATDPENGVTEFATTEAEFEELKARFQENWGGGE